MKHNCLIPSIPKNSILISVEGNIGSGKSTFLKKISESLDLSIIFEPAEKWQNIQSHNLLDEFYRDMNRWGYSFQTYVFLTRLQEIEEKISTTKDINIVERSVYTDKFCFAKALHTMGKITNLEWLMYCQWYDWLIENHVRPFNGIIYLQVDPKISFDRVYLRNRSEESGIPFDYISLLHEYHEDWLVRKNNISEKIAKIPVLTLDCNKDFEHTEEEWKKLVTSVNNFLENIIKIRSI